jgi:hypothetical protein
MATASLPLWAALLLATLSPVGLADTGQVVKGLAVQAASSTALSAVCSRNFKKLGQKVGGFLRAHLPQAPISPEEVSARVLALHQGLEEWKTQAGSHWRWPIEDIPGKMLTRLNAQLDHDGRKFLELTPQEQHDLVEMIAAETVRQSERDHVAAEAKARIAAARSELASESGNRAGQLRSGKLQRVVLDALHEDLTHDSVNFTDLQPAEQSRRAKNALTEAGLRFDAVNQAVERRLADAGHELGIGAKAMKGLVLDELHQELTKRKARFGDLSGPQQAELVDNALQEVLARIPEAERAIDQAIGRTGRPWNGWLMWRRNHIKEKIVGWVGDELAKATPPRHFRDLNANERQSLIDTITGAALSAVQSRPTFVVAGLGYGIPIAFGYVGSIFLPDAFKPAWYILTGGLTGPFSAGVNYYLNGKLKPIFTVKLTDHGASDAKTPFVQEMERIGSASVGFSDPFKDGRNITKDSEIPLRDALNDAAWLIAGETDAQRMVAGAVLYHATSFPEVSLNSLSAFTLYMKLKDRFANPQAYANIQRFIREGAAKKGVSPNGALTALDKILQPENWSQFPPSPQSYSAQADAELQQMLEAAHQEKDPKELSKGVAWAALFYAGHYPSMQISQATSFRFFMRDRDRLANPQTYQDAKATIAREAAALHVDPKEAIRRLDLIVRTDLWTNTATAPTSPAANPVTPPPSPVTPAEAASTAPVPVTPVTPASPPVQSRALVLVSPVQTRALVPVTPPQSRALVPVSKP